MSETETVSLDDIINDLPPADDGGVKPSATATLASVRADLDARMSELLVASRLDDVQRLTIGIQKLRISEIILLDRENPDLSGGSSDRLFKEIKLLVAMVKQASLGDDDNERSQRDRVKTAEDKLREAGVTTQGARAIVEIFTRLSTDAIPQSDAGSSPGRS